jgi:outer membrane protein
MRMVQLQAMLMRFRLYPNLFQKKHLYLSIPILNLSLVRLCNLKFIFSLLVLTSYMLFVCSIQSDSKLEKPFVEKRLVIDLERAVEIAVTNYYVLKVIKNKDLAYRELITEKWREYLPKVGIGYIRQRFIISDGQDAISNEIRLNVEQVIFDGGRRGLELDIAKMERLLNKEDFVIVFNKLKLDVQEAFFRVLAASGKILLNQKSLQRGKDQLKFARLELKFGFTTNVQVMSVASRVQEVELALLKAKNEYLRAKNDLKLVMNVEYETDLVLEGSLFKDFYLYKPKLEMNQLIAQARSGRHEILKAKVAISKAKLEKDFADNAWIPRISIGGYRGRVDENFPVRRQNWGVNVNMTVPLGSSTSTTSASTGERPNNLQATAIRNDNYNFTSSANSNLQLFDNMSYNRKVAEAKVKLVEAVAQRNLLNQSIAIEVNKACDLAKENWDAIHIGNGQVYFRFESLKLMTTRYSVGEAKRSDILFAETELVTAQGKLVDSLASFVISSYELEWVSGLKPGSLKLFEYIPGKGNSLLTQILEDNFKIEIPKNLPRETTDSVLDQYDIDTETEENLLDQIEIE